jgi:hypothetical protein
VSESVAICNHYAEGRCYLNLPVSGYMMGDIKPDQWPALKALAQTDVAERLMALAEAQQHFMRRDARVHICQRHQRQRRIRLDKLSSRRRNDRSYQPR